MRLRIEKKLFNPIRPAFSVLCQDGDGGGGAEGPDTKNQGQHQLTEMKFCMNHYSPKSIPDVKF